MRCVDLNADLGEGFPYDAQVMEHVTSVNIACGAHAGTEETMRASIALALEKGACIGAHPGYEDRENFGRTDMDLSPSQVFDLVFKQVSTLSVLCTAQGARMRHVKPHGQLYNRAAKDAVCAQAVAQAVRQVDGSLRLVGLAGSKLLEAGAASGLSVAGEFFADRNYLPDGSLVPRRQSNACIADEDEALERTVSAVQTGLVSAVDSTLVPVSFQTICIHGDNPKALAFAARIRLALEGAGIAVLPPI